MTRPKRKCVEDARYASAFENLRKVVECVRVNEARPETASDEVDCLVCVNHDGGIAYIACALETWRVVAHFARFAR